MPHLSVPNLELSDEDLQKWIDCSGSFDFENNEVQQTLHENAMLLDSKMMEPVSAYGQHCPQLQTATNWCPDTTPSKQAFPQDGLSPLSALSTPNSKDSPLYLKDKGAANNVSNKGSGIVTGTANSQPAKNDMGDQTRAPMAETSFATPMLLNPYLPTAGSGLSQFYGTQAPIHPGFFWNVDPSIMNNGNTPPLSTIPTAWQISNPMQHGQHLQAPNGIIYANSPYHHPYLAQGVGNIGKGGGERLANQPVDSGTNNSAQQDNFPQHPPKRRVSGQSSTSRRVSPSDEQPTPSGSNQGAQDVSVPPQAGPAADSSKRSLPLPEIWAANRSYDKPAALYEHYKNALTLAPKPASELTAMDRLGVHDYALRMAFARGARRAQEVITEALSKDLGAQKLFGCNLQWPIGYSRSMVEESVRAYLLQTVKFGPNDDPATAAGMIRESCQKNHPGLFPSPNDAAAPESPQRRRPQASQSPARKDVHQPNATRSKPKSQDKPANPEKKRKTAKEKGDPDTYVFTGKVIPRRFSEVVHWAYACNDGQNRILDEESFKTVLKRTEEKHQKEGTTFELKVAENVATEAQSEDAFVPSTSSGRKRKATEPIGDEPAAKKPTGMTLPEPPVHTPSVASKNMPTQSSGPLAFQSGLVLPTAATDGPGNVAMALTNQKDTASTAKVADKKAENKADRDSQRINELTKIDKGLPESVILDFMYPTEGSPYEVVREAARKGLGDQSHLLLDSSYRDPVLKTFDANHLKLMEVSQNSRPEWDPRARNKAKRDRKKAAQLEEIKAARASRDGAANMVNADDKTPQLEAALEAELNAALQDARAGPTDICGNGSL